MPSVANNLAPMQKSRGHPWLAMFFAFGTMMCVVMLALLLFPGTALDTSWRLNPDARPAFESLGSWSVVIMVVVGAACLVAAIGLWRRAFWGTRLALAILSINIVGDLINALLRHDYRALIGLPVGAAMIFFLLRSRRSVQRLSHSDKKSIV